MYITVRLLTSLIGPQFLQKGVLHRDTSLRNIIITGKSELGRRGALIDDNNAIFWAIMKLLQMTLFRYPWSVRCQLISYPCCQVHVLKNIE